MSGFSDEWLALREPADHRARDTDLSKHLGLWLAGQTRTGESASRPVSIIDLGAGTGSNFRYLAPRLGLNQHWQLIDNDAELLGGLASRMALWAGTEGFELQTFDEGLLVGGESVDGRFSARIDTLQLDLANDLSELPLKNTDLLTCSALLDLCSAVWLDALVGRLSEVPTCAALFVLNYDGHVQWQPALPDDARVRDLLNCHQRIDKGLGAALGPEAGAYTRQSLQAAGLRVTAGASRWEILPQHAELQQALVAGWVEAGMHIEPDATQLLQAWYQHRMALCRAGDSHLQVGHVDLLALPDTGPSR